MPPLEKPHLDGPAAGGLDLPTPRTVAIVSPPLDEVERVNYRYRRRRRRLQRWVRLCLVLLTVPWLAVFIVAARLDPYQDEKVWLAETHRQLGLPPCTFKAVIGLPCPSCGMSSSFALLVRGDLWHSVQANFVGTLLAVFGLVFVPWSLLSAWRARLVYIRDVEPIIVRLVVGFMIVLFGRWAIVLMMCWLGSG